MAERGGFEPPNGEIPLTVFETAAFDRSAISPEKYEKRVKLNIQRNRENASANRVFYRPPGVSVGSTNRAGEGRIFILSRRFDSRCRFRGMLSVFQIRASSCPLAAAFSRALPRGKPFFQFFRETTPGVFRI